MRRIDPGRRRIAAAGRSVARRRSACRPASAQVPGPGRSAASVRCAGSGRAAPRHRRSADDPRGRAPSGRMRTLWPVAHAAAGCARVGDDGGQSGHLVAALEQVAVLEPGDLECPARQSAELRHGLAPGARGVAGAAPPRQSFRSPPRSSRSRIEGRVCLPGRGADFPDGAEGAGGGRRGTGKGAAVARAGGPDPGASPAAGRRGRRPGRARIAGAFPTLSTICG